MEERIGFDCIPRFVKNGIEFLDSIAFGWRQKIDISSLHMDYPKSCIAGQVFGSFCKMPLEGRTFHAVELGMDCPGLKMFEGRKKSLTEEEESVYYEALKKEWINQLNNI